MYVCHHDLLIFTTSYESVQDLCPFVIFLYITGYYTCIFIQQKNGGGTIVENTTLGIKRDINFYKNIAKETGVNVIAGTGQLRLAFGFILVSCSEI